MVPPGSHELPFDNPDQFRIVLDSESVRFHCSGDGETLMVDGHELCPRDLGEYGELRLVDLSKQKRFDTLIGTPLRQISYLKSYSGHYTIGFILEFDLGLLVICNWGDELKVWGEVPKALFADEGIQVELA